MLTCLREETCTHGILGHARLHRSSSRGVRSQLQVSQARTSSQARHLSTNNLGFKCTSPPPLPPLPPPAPTIPLFSRTVTSSLDPSHSRESCSHLQKRDRVFFFCWDAAYATRGSAARVWREKKWAESSLFGPEGAEGRSKSLER